MAIKNLDKTGLGRVWANIKSYISSKLPTDYINGLSVSGKVITYTKADGTNGTITTQDTNTTYSNMSQTEADTGTATTARSISAKVLNTKIENKLADYALSSGIPTKTSQLTNDSGFLTSHQSLSNYVDVSSSQIITGAKKFTGSGIYNANLVKGTLPTATSYINLALSGSNAYTSSAHRIGLLESAIDTAGTVSTYITAYKFELGSKVSTAIGVRYPLNSTPYAYAPNPDDGSSGQKIATTNWVEGKKYLTSHQDISGKQDKISTYVSNLIKSGNTLLIYTNGNTNSPSGSISLNTTTAGDIGTTVTAYFTNFTGASKQVDYDKSASANGGGSVSVTASSAGLSANLGSPTPGSVYSGSYLASVITATKATCKDTVTTSSTGSSTHLINVRRVAQLVLSFTRLNSSYKYLCTTAATANPTETFPSKSYTTAGSTDVSGSWNLNSNKSTFMRVQ